MSEVFQISLRRDFVRFTLSAYALLDRLKISRAVFAQRTNEVVRELFTLIDIAAYVTYIAFLALCFRFRFDILLIVCVGYGLFIGDNPGFRNAANEHAMGIQIYILLHFQGEKCVDIMRQEGKSVCGT